MLETN